MLSSGPGRAIAALLLVLALGGCAGKSREEQLPAPGTCRVVDFRGTEIALSRPATRIVCLIESALTGLYMLRAESLVVGVPTSVYQESVRDAYAALDERIASESLRSPGNWDFVNVESVLALRPDLVILWSEQRDVVVALEERGVTVYGVFLRSFADVEKEISDLGVLTATTARADTLLAFVRDEVRALRGRLPAGGIRPRVYFMWSQGPLETAGSGSTVDALLALSGADNVVETPQEHVVVHLEDVLRWDPDVIVQWHNPREEPEELAMLDGWKSLRAVREGRVHELPSTFLCDFWTLKYVIAAHYVAVWCHPMLADSLDVAAEQQRILVALYGGKGAHLR